MLHQMTQLVQQHVVDGPCRGFDQVWVQQDGPIRRAAPPLGLHLHHAPGRCRRCPGQTLNHQIEPALEYLQGAIPVPLAHGFVYPVWTQVLALHAQLAADQFAGDLALLRGLDDLQYVPPAQVQLALSADPLSRPDIPVALGDVVEMLEDPPGAALDGRFDRRQLGILRGIDLHHAVGMHMHPYGCLLVFWHIAQVVPELPVTVPGHVLQRLFVLMGLYRGHQRPTPLRRICTTSSSMALALSSPISANRRGNRLLRTSCSMPTGFREFSATARFTTWSISKAS